MPRHSDGMTGFEFRLEQLSTGRTSPGHPVLTRRCDRVRLPMAADETRACVHWEKLPSHAQRGVFETGTPGWRVLETEVPSGVISVFNAGPGRNGSSKRNAAAPVTAREPVFTKRGEDLSGWIVGHHACNISGPYLFSASEKSVTVKKQNELAATLW